MTRQAPYYRGHGPPVRVRGVRASDKEGAKVQQDALIIGAGLILHALHPEPLLYA